MAEERVVFRITAPGAEEAARAIERMARASKQADTAERRLDAAGRRVSSTFDRTRSSARGVTVEYERQTRVTDRLWRSTRNLGIAFTAATALFTGSAIQAGVGGLVRAEQQIRAISGGLNVANADLGNLAATSVATARDLQFLEQQTERLGVVFDSSAKSYSQLAVANSIAGIEADVTRQLFLGVTEAGTALKLSGSQVALALQAIQQTASKGRVSMEELRRQLSNHIPGATQIAARALGVSTQEFERLVEAGLDARELLPAFAQELRRTFGDTARLNADTSIANINRLHNALFFLRVGIADEVNPALGDLALSLRDLAQDRGFLDAVRALSQGLAWLVDGLATVVGWTNEARGYLALFQQALVEILGHTLRLGAGLTGFSTGVVAGTIDLVRGLTTGILQLGQVLVASQSLVGGDLFGLNEAAFDTLAALEARVDASLGGAATSVRDFRDQAQQAFEDGAAWADLYAEALGDVAVEQLALDASSRASRGSLDDLQAGFQGAAGGARKLDDLVGQVARRLRSERASLDAWSQALDDLEPLELSATLGDSLRQATDLDRNPVADFWAELLDLTTRRRDVLREILPLEGQIELEVQDTLALARELQLSDAQRLALVEQRVAALVEANGALGEQRQLVTELGKGFERLARDQLAGLFAGLVPEAEGVFGEILASFGRLLADMAAEALAANLGEALFGGRAAAGAATGAGAGAAGAGAAAGTAASSAALSAAALALVPIAIFAVGSYLGDRRRARSFGFGAGATFSDGSLSFATVDPGTQADALTTRLHELMSGILGEIEGSIESLGSITVLARRDGRAFRAFVGGELVGTFRDAEQALERAVVAAFSAASVDDPDVQTALRASAGATVEQLARNVETALRLRDGELSNAALELRDTLSSQLREVFAFVENDLRAAGFALARGQGLIAGQLQRAVDDFLGVAAPDDTTQRRDLINQAIRDARAQIEEEIRLRADLLERLLTSQGGVTAGVETFTGTLAQASDATGRAFLAGGRTLSAAAGLSLADLQEQLDFWRRELDLLPELLGADDLPRTVGGGGRRQRRDALRDQLAAIVSGRDLGLDGGASAVTTTLDQIRELRAEAAQLGGDFGNLDRALGVLRGRVETTIQGFISQSLALVGETPGPQASATGGSSITYARLTQDLAALNAELDGWRQAMEAAREELGALAISQAEFDAALQAQLTAFGEQAIATLGLPLDQIRQEVDQVAGTLQFLRENQELLGLSAARFAEIVTQVGQQQFQGLWSGLLRFIGGAEEFEDRRLEMARIFFEAEIEQYRLRFELLRAEGIFTQAQIDAIEDAFAFIDANLDDLFAASVGAANDNASPFAGGGQGLELPTGGSNPYDDAQAFLDQLTQAEGGASDPFEAITARFAAMREQALGLGAAFVRFGTSLSEVLERIEALEAAEIAAVFDQALDPLRAIQDQLSFGGLSALDPRGQFDSQFQRARDLLQEALPSNPDNQGRLDAIAELQGLLPQLLALAPNVLTPTALLSFQDFVRQALSAVTGYDPLAGTLGGGDLGTGTGGGGGLTTGRDGNVLVAGGRFARADADALRTDLQGIRAEIAGLRRDVTGVGGEVAGFRRESVGRGRVAANDRRTLATEMGRLADVTDRAGSNPTLRKAARE